MLRINYKDYEISQAKNGHVMICKDNQMLFNAQCNKKLSEKELKQELEYCLKLIEILEKEGVFDVKD